MATVVTARDARLRKSTAYYAERLLRLRARLVASILAAGGAEHVGEPAVHMVSVRRGDDGELIDALARAVGAELPTTRVAQVAERLADRLRRGRDSVVVCLEERAASSHSWISLVLEEVVSSLAALDGRAAAPGGTRLVLVGPAGCPMLAALAAGAVPTVDIAPALDAREILSWFDVFGRTVGAAIGSSSISLTQLEAALRSPALAPDIAAMLSGCVTTAASSVEPSAHEVESPWGWLRHAAQALRLGDEERADHAVQRAEALADDPDARRDVGRRWLELLEPRSAAERVLHARRSTERALASGDVDEAVRWSSVAVRAAEIARVSGGEEARLLEAQGRALAAKGDVVMARAVLARARDLAITAELDPAALASIDVETAEAAYLAGDLTASEAEATRALAAAGDDHGVRLHARNVLGKVLLARGSWHRADTHFAADAADASRLGDNQAELRALLNRAIALFSAERLDEAESLFEAVLEGGRASNDQRAQALALENLAVIASLRREYGKALDRFRAAIAGLKQIGQASMIAGAAHNLGYLYLRLGDVAQATAMARFASTLFRRGLAAPVVAEGDDLRARIAARLGRSEEALAAISRAREILRAAGESARVAECYRLEARLALDDGDVRGARLALDAANLDDAPRARAEHAILEAEWFRSNGGQALEVLVGARESLALSRASGDEDLIIEAHLLIAEVSRVIGDRELLQRHVGAAAGVRDAMLGSIPESHHSHFIARPDMMRLAKLERLLESEPITVAPASAPTEVAGPRSRAMLGGDPRRIVGSDPSLRALMLAIRRVAASDTTVLVRGESGTGKELVAEALHEASERAGGPLVKVNCAALVETLLLSELFGHEKGAFTGAVARRRGRFELADGGMLFLDEIGDISPRTQVALLRILQEKTFERVGGTTPIRVDVRVVCATHRDLATMVTRGEFREDLYYRLRGVQLDVPPLRARLGDLPELCGHILKRIAAEHGQAVRSISPDALELLALHKWPGNVRELENVLRAVALLGDGPELTPRDLVEHCDVFRGMEARPSALVIRPWISAPRRDEAAFDGPDEVVRASADDEEGPGGAPPSLPEKEASATGAAYGQIRAGGVSLFEMKRMIERDCIARALAETRGNITRAAALLGMKRPRLSQLVKHHGLAATFTEGS